MEGRGLCESVCECVCVLGKCLNISSVNAVQLVLVLASRKKHLESFLLEVGHWESLCFSLKHEKERAVVINFYPDINWEEVTCKHVEDSVCQSWLEWRESECEQHESFWHLRNVSQYRTMFVPWGVFLFVWGCLFGLFACLFFVLRDFVSALFGFFVGFFIVFWFCNHQQLLSSASHEYGKSQCGWGLILKSFKCPIGTVSHSVFEKSSAW